MAEEENDSSNKTEEPSERRLQKAREQGQMPYTKEIGSNLSLLAIVAAFYIWGGSFFESIVTHFRFSFASLNKWDALGAPFWSHLMPPLEPILRFMSTLLIISFIFPILGHVMQKGIEPKWDALGLKWEKLSPVAGLKQLVSFEQWIVFAKNFLKTMGLGFIFYLTIKPHADRIIYMASFPVETSLGLVITIFVKFFLFALIFLTVLAGSDYVINFVRIRKMLRMSRQELKDEHKDSEGNPEIRNKVKQIQRERSKRKIQKEVPKATVVVTNPTHYAVALKYEKGKLPVPKVVAKGVDNLAKRIREVAQDNRVPIVESPALARALYREVKAGREIPFKFYKAVAKIIGAILRLEEEKKRQRTLATHGGRPVQHRL